MNICMAVGVNPADGRIAVVGTDGINQVRFEPVVDGKFVRANLALVQPVTLTKTVKDLIGLLRANPGKYAFASPGVGTPPHLTGEQLRLSLALDLVQHGCPHETALQILV